MWARQPMLRKKFHTKRAIAIHGWSTASAHQGVTARIYTTRRRQVADDRIAQGAQEPGRPRDLYQEAQALDPIGVRCEIARTRHDLRFEIAGNPIKLYQNNPSSAQTLRSPEALFVTSLQKTARASSETSVDMLTKRIKRPSPSKMTRNRRERVLEKNLTPKAPAV